MIGSRTRRILRWIVTPLAGLLLLALAALVVLRTTNARPVSSPGWRRFTNAPSPRGEVAAAAVGRRLVVAGGLGGVGAATDAVDVFDIATNRWTTGHKLPAPRHHAAAASLDGWVYVTGGAAGSTDWTPMDNVWRARPGGRWTSVEKMPEGRQGHAMVAWRGRLYVFGGVGRSDATLIYDPRSGWTKGAPIPFGRNHLRAAAWSKGIWVVGGRDGRLVRRADVYRPSSDTWLRGPDLPEPMSAMAVGVVGGELNVVGGEDPSLAGGRVLQEHYALAPGARRWSTHSPAQLSVHGAGFAVIDEQLIIVGGASRQGALSVISWTSVTQAFGSQPRRVSAEALSGRERSPMAISGGAGSRTAPPQRRRMH